MTSGSKFNFVRHPTMHTIFSAARGYRVQYFFGASDLPFSSITGRIYEARGIGRLNIKVSPAARYLSDACTQLFPFDRDYSHMAHLL